MEVEWLVKRENSERVRDRFELANSFGVQLTVSKYLVYPPRLLCNAFGMVTVPGTDLIRKLGHYPKFWSREKRQLAVL